MTEDFDLDDQVEQLSLMLCTTELHAMDWSDTMVCAPTAIGIIGDCLLLSSHRRASSIQLSGPTMTTGAKSLSANLRQCAMSGERSFSEAGSKMRNISSHALMLSKDGGGVIDRIMKLAAKEQTPAVARELTRQRDNLKRVVTKCRQDAEALQNTFQAWEEETKILRTALNISEDEVNVKTETAAIDLVNTEQLLEQLKKQLGFDGLNLVEIQERMFERKEKAEAAEIAGAPILAGALFLSMLGASTIGAPIIIGASAAIWGRKILAGATQWKRDTQVREYQSKSLQAQTLEQQVQKLASASCTLKEIQDIVWQAVRQILTLQRQIQGLLTFFEAMFKRVESLDGNEAKDIQEHIEDQGYKEDDFIKEIMVANAVDLKMSFTFIGRLSDMYSKISMKYLIPGMHTVQMLGLSDDSQTGAQMDWKTRELEQFKQESVENVRRMTIEHQDQLSADMTRLIRQGIVSLKSVRT